MLNLQKRDARVSTRLGSLHVQTIGEGRPTVLWPSMFVDSSTWAPLLPLLAERAAVSRRFVLIDAPGLGRSDPLRRRSNIAEAADAARDALAVLAPDEPVDWIGNAFGGHVGFELARDPRVLRSLVAISAPTEPISSALRRRIGLLAPILRVAGPIGPVRDAVIDAMLTDRSAADPAIRDVVIDSLGRPGKASMALALKSFILDRVDVTDRLQEIRVPSLFVASDDRGDWSPADAQRAAARTPGARMVVVEGARTLVPLERPAEVAEEIHAFWNERA